MKAAAVADFHLAKVPPQKMKKTAARLSLELDPTPDILAELGRKKGDRLLVGFAAETENLQQETRRKLEAKNCDMVVGNLVGGGEAGFRVRPERGAAGHAHRRDSFPCRAPRNARWPTASSTRFSSCDCSSAATIATMDAELLRRYLEYYQDLGIKTLYRRAAPPLPKAPAQEVAATA